MNTRITASAELLHIHIEKNGHPLLLSDLTTFSQQLQKTLLALARNITEDENPDVEFELVDASTGSLNLKVRAVTNEPDEIEPDKFLSTFADDLSSIRRETYRPGLTSGLLKRYTSLIRTLGNDAAEISFTYADKSVLVDGNFREGFRVATKARRAEDVTVTGTLEVVNAHRQPPIFHLYPKLAIRERIECEFSTEMLPTVADILKRKNIIQVTGRGFYPPVGIYPLRIEVNKAPRELVFDRDALRGAVQSIDLLQPGVSVSEYVQRNREAAGIAD
jgi:hypothetical protein